MSKVMLIFATALLALLSGALFYAARIPLKAPAEPPVAAAVPAATAALNEPVGRDAVTYVEFTLPDISGNARSFSEWHGKNRLINFWATWCAPCRREIPLLKAFQDQHAGDGFEVIGIAVDFPEAVSDYAESARFNYPVLVGEQDAMAVAESSGIEFRGMPFTMFVASDGEYLSAYIGELHQEQLDSVVDVMKRLDLAEIDKDAARSELDTL